MSSNGETAGKPAQKGTTFLLWVPILGLCGWLGYLMLQPTTTPVAIELETADRELLDQLEVASSLIAPKAIIRDQEAQVAVAYLSPPADAVPAIQPPQSQHSLLLPPPPMSSNEVSPDAIPRKVEVKMNAPKRLRIAIASPMATPASAPVLQPPADDLQDTHKSNASESLVSAPALKQPLVQMQFGSIEPPPRLNSKIGLLQPTDGALTKVAGEPVVPGDGELETLTFSNTNHSSDEQELETLTFEATPELNLVGADTSKRCEDAGEGREVDTLPPLTIALPSNLSWEQADRLPGEKVPTTEPASRSAAEVGTEEVLEASPAVEVESVRVPEIGPQTLQHASRPLPPLTKVGEAGVAARADKPNVQWNPYATEEVASLAPSNRKLSDRRNENAQPIITVAETVRSQDGSSRTERKLQDLDSANAQYMGSIQLQHRNGQTIELPQNVRHIAVADETICEVIRLSDHEISLIGSKVGVTKVAIITEDGLEWTLDIEVKVSTHSVPSVSGKNLKELQATINRMHRETRIDIRSNSDGSITVVGNTLNEESAKQILNLVRKLCLVPVHDQVVVKTR